MPSMVDTHLALHGLPRKCGLVNCSYAHASLAPLHSIGLRTACFTPALTQPVSGRVALVALRVFALKHGFLTRCLQASLQDPRAISQWACLGAPLIS
jgi:hypothetical protein